MRSIFKIILFLIYNLCAASYHEQYRVPQAVANNWESFVFNDREYIIQNLPATWENAKIICGGHHNGTMAVLDTREKAEFLAEALSESQFEIDSIWVGASRQSPSAGEYRWWDGVELARTRLDVLDTEDDEPAGRYPVWVNRTRVPVPINGADCVALERVHHDWPLLLDLPCSLERAFACEREFKKRYQIVQLNSVRCATGEYKIFDGKMQWEQAAAYCLLHRMTLANIPSTRCLKKLGMAMLKTRPSIESAWVGARGALGQWSWVDTGVSILQTPTYPDSGEWPPLRDSTLKQTGCLQVDRHASRHPVLMEARCDRRMQFICQTGVKSVPTAPASDELHYYSLVRQKLFWQHAYDNCLAMNGSLATVDSRDVLVQLMLVMGEDRDEPVHHIWISGRLNKTRDEQTGAVAYAWHNPTNGQRVPDRSFRDTSGLFIPPWLDDEYSMDSPCLNLDRQDHMNALVYGLPCDTPQYSVCMIEKTPKEVVQHVTEPVTEHVTEHVTELVQSL